MSSKLILIFLIAFKLQNINGLEKVQVARCNSSRVPEEIVIPSSLKSKSHNETLIFQMIQSTVGIYCEGKWAEETVSYLEKSPKLRFMKNGIAFLNNAYYNTDQYCISRFDSHSLTISHCKIKCSPSGPFVCVPKCCPLNQIMKSSKNGTHACGPLKDDHWTPTVYSSKSNIRSWDSLPLDSNSTLSKLHYILADDVLLSDEVIPLFYQTINFTVEVEGEIFNDTFDGAEFRLLENGSLISKDEEIQEYLIHTKFCIDGHVVEGRKHKESESDQVAFYLPGIESETNTELKLGFFIFGIVFLVLTVLMYLAIWDKHNIHGWTIFSFVVSMLLFFTIQATICIIQTTKDVSFLESKTCLTVSILGHFTFLCTLCWMSIINFDFFDTFKNLSPSQERNKNFRRYLYYFGFALTVPSFVVGISIILHFVPTYNENHGGALPGYAKSKYCSLHEDSKKWYLYTPMAFLLGFNLVMFSWTVFTLWTYKRKTQSASGTSGQKQSWILFCKLFLIMGLTWVLEVLSGFLDLEFVLIDIINLLQAFAIFVIFAVKRENLLWIYKKHHFTRGFIGPILRTKLCYVAELDTAEQTEMTSAEKNRTLVTFRSRISSGSDNGYK